MPALADHLYYRGLATHESGGDIESALTALREAVEQGHAGAAVYLGQVYSFGMRVPRDEVEAIKWYTIAAERGYPGAKERLDKLVSAQLLEEVGDYPTEPKRLPSAGPGEIRLEGIRANLANAAESALSLARKLVLQELPDQLLFLLDTAASGPSVMLEYGERRVGLGTTDDPQPLNKAVEWLWHDGHAAMWVDVNARRADDQFTYIGLMRSRGFVARPDRLYHKAEGYPPFHVTGLFAPANWESVEKNGRFKLGWMYDKQNEKREGT